MNETETLNEDARNSTETKTFHIDKWIEILREHQI